MTKNQSLKLLSKSALRHTDFRSPARPIRKKKPFIKKKRATLKKNFLSFSFKKQIKPKTEQFLGRKQINVLKQWEAVILLKFEDFLKNLKFIFCKNYNFLISISHILHFKINN